MFNPVEFHQQALVLCAIGQECYQRGWSPATSSNYSVRLNADTCALTSSGKHKGRLQPEDILVVDMQGKALTNGKPSAETLLHTQLYQHAANIGAVLHTHSPASVLISRLLNNENALVLENWELLKALSGINSHAVRIEIPIFENDQDIAALAQKVAAHMAKQPIHAYLIRGHGIYTWGESMDECFRHLEALECLMGYELALRGVKA
ncbi:MAG: methylthioribulose 1-phosphate dehydratase [Oceanospirillaceae bacterium]|nr:methylthioribulose 1-phosphate dehydratase [Oceanospirillaceae bacterium]